MSASKLYRGWAVFQIAVLISSVGYGVMPLAASAHGNNSQHEFHDGKDHHTGDSHDGNENDNDNNQDDNDGHDGHVKGSITVCKILVDAQNNVVDGSNLPGGTTFVLTGGTSPHTLPDTTVTPTLSFNESFISNEVNDAQCTTYNDLALGTYHYGAEVVTSSAGFEAPQYNDQFSQTINAVGDFYNLDVGGSNLNADGNVTLTKNRPDRTLVVLNKEKPTGSITVCKIALDAEGTPIAGTAGTTFTIPGLTPAPVTSQGAPDGQIPDSVFTTPLTLGTHILDASNGSDAQCTTYSNLVLNGNGYYYGQETISDPANWLAPKYNDQNSTDIHTTANFFGYSGELFDGNAGNDEDRNQNADGHITLTTDRPNRTLVVLNQEAPNCEDQLHSQTIVSDTLTLKGADPAVLVPTPYNSRWTVSTSSLGALWIWGETVFDRVATTTETFTRDYTIVGTPTGATLNIAADNSYTVSVNGHAVGADATEFNYQSVADDASTNPDTYTIPAGDLVTGTNTITFVVTNWHQAHATEASNPAGLLYKLVVNNNECVPPPPPPPPVCNPEINLVDNGGFEAPVQDPNTWSIVPSSNPLLKWLTAWVSPETTGTLGLEIERLNAYVNHSGDQHAELDGDHPVTTWENVPTTPGTTYQLSFWHAARGDSPTGAADNTMDVLVDGSVVRSVSGDTAAAPGTDNGYVHYTNTFTSTGATTKVEFKDTGTDNSYGNFIDDVGLSCVPPVQEPTTATVVATKIVCDNESDLPNMSGGADITAGTASAFLSTHPTCHLQSDWQFQWRTGVTPSDGTNPGDNNSTPAGAPWTTFGLTNGSGVVSTDVPSGALVWVREVLQDGYVPFTGASDESNVSAEMYCNTDVLHYDNYDFINPVVAGNTYYCVAFNAPTVAPQTPPQCSDTLDNDLDGKVDALDPGCWTDPNDPNTYVGSDNSETGPTDVCPSDEGIQTNENQCTEDDNSGGGPTTESFTNTGGGGGGGGGPIGLFGSGGGGGVVLGASTESCSPLLTQFLRMGRNNDKGEVTKLQNFLNNFMHAGLTVNGIFGQSTFNAVEDFQLKYWEQVLNPWVPHGLPTSHTPTGYVYKTTQRWVNLLYCSTLTIPLPQLP